MTGSFFGKLLKKVSMLIGMCVLIISSFICPTYILAEGTSADMSMILSRSVVNIGKTFSVTVAVTPNANINITSFELTLGFDSSKVDVVLEGGAPKITKPSRVPSTFKISPNQSGDSIVIVADDDSAALDKPIVTSGNTGIVTLYFKVKSSATVGSAANFTISGAVVSQAIGVNVEEIALNVISPKAATIGALLDSNTFLSALGISTGSLTPAFAKAVNAYTIDVPDDVDAITFTPTTESAKSKSVIAGGTGLNYGPNTATIVVTAEDTDYTRTYTITINRASPVVSISSDEESSSEESSSSEASVESSSTVSSQVSEVIADDNDDLAIWKIMTAIFAALFLITGGIALWLAIDKARNRDKIIKVKHV